MDQAAATWTGGDGRRDAAADVEAARPGRWLWIRYRALRARRDARRARGGAWIDGVSPWAFWGLHR